MAHPAIAAFQDHVLKTLEHLQQEFSKLQTGRANAAVVEHISIEAYGQRMELKSVASISVQDARSIVIQPWDKSVLGAVEKALQVSDLGISPVNDGVVIRLNFPPMTEERRKHIVKVVGQLAEAAHIRIRQERQVANDAIKQMDDEDERDRAQKELQKLVDDANEKITSSAKKKEQEVLTI
jgi:ribosome recycling factor